MCDIIAFKSAMEVMEYPIEIGVNYQFVCFDKLQTEQQLIVKFYQIAVDNLDFEKLCRLLDLLRESIKFNNGSDLNGAQWYAFNCIICAMKRQRSSDEVFETLKSKGINRFPPHFE